MTEKLRLQKTAFMLFVFTVMGRALAQTGGTPGGATGGTPETVFTRLGCYFVNVLSSPALVAVAGAALLLIFGWNKVFAEMNAFQSFKSGIIGVVIILVAAGVSTALFGAACA